MVIPTQKTAQVKIGYLLNKSVVKIGCQKITQKNTKKLLQFMVFWETTTRSVCVFYHRKWPCVIIYFELLRRHQGGAYNPLKNKKDHHQYR